MNKTVIQIPGYVLYGHNGKNIHVRGMKRSGGVSFFVRESLSNHYDITTIDDSYEGILW